MRMRSPTSTQRKWNTSNNRNHVNFPQLFLLATTLFCAQAAAPPLVGGKTGQHLALIISDGMLPGARSIASHLVDSHHFTVVCSRHKGDSTGKHQCRRINSSNAKEVDGDGEAFTLLADVPSLPGVLIYVYGRHHTHHANHNNDDGGLAGGGGGRSGIHGGTALGRRLHDVFLGAHTTSTPTAFVRADSIAHSMLVELDEMVTRSTMVPAIDAILAHHSATAASELIAVDVLRAQPPFATRLPLGWSNRGGQTTSSAATDTGGNATRSVLPPKHSVDEKLTTAIHMLRNVAKDPHEANLLADLIVSVKKRQADDPERAMLLGDGSKNVHDAIKHYTELHNVSMFNLRRTVPDTDSTALVFCEKCKGTGVDPCDAEEWGANRVRWLMMYNRMYKMHMIDKQQLEEDKKLPDCGAVSEVLLHIQTTGEVRVLKQAIGNAECGLGHAFASRPQPQGYEDPRLFSWNGQPYVLINGCRKGHRNMFLHDVRQNTTVRLWLDIAGSSSSAGTEGDHHTEKNWTPYEDDGKLRFVYSFGQTRALGILELTDKTTGACNIVHGAATYDSDFHVAGSTQLVQWMYPYFVGYAHTRHGPQPQILPKKRDLRTSEYKEKRYKYVYRAVPVVLNAITFDVWYGNAVAFDAPAHAFAKPSEGVFKDVQFPFDVQLHGDHVKIGIEFQDRCPAWVKMSIPEFSSSLPMPAS